jgi:cytosine/adenosine deaminase-related metal-dependent hydrolase
VTTLLIDRCRLAVTMDDEGRELTDASIVIEDGWIHSIESGRADGQHDQVIDGRRMVALPGFVNTHHHLYQNLTRAFPLNEGRTLFPWLTLLYPIWAGLDEDMIRASTKAGLAELALSGCTASSDHLYLFPRDSDGFMDAQIEAAQAMGVRFHATRGSMDLGESEGGLPPDAVVQPIDTIMRDSERVIDHYHDRAAGAMIRVGLAPCSPFSVTADLMRESAALARDRGVRLHTHIAETLDEDAFARERYDRTPVALLQGWNWLGPDVWLAHCVHPSSEDVGNLATSRASVAHCPTSNMLLASGMAPVMSMRSAGIAVGLGVDGSASNDAGDLRQEIKQALLVSRIRDGVGALTARDALQLATRGGAACLGRDDIGCLAPGKAADIVLIDVETLEMAGSEDDLAAGIVLCAARPHTVLVHGKPIVRHGRLLTADQRELAREQARQSRRLLAKAGLVSA